jgi:flavorubredoxin
MTTRTDEIAADIYRISTFVREAAPDGFTFNQFLVRAEQPLLFHTGPRAMFPLVAEAVARLIRIEQLRWITFGHVESDECGAMNLWLAAAPHAEVAHGAVGVAVSLNDLADRAPRVWNDGESIDLGGKRARHLDTPHVPHNWESRLLFEETTGTLLCGDLFTHTGAVAPLTRADIVAPARAAEELFHASSITAQTGASIRRLAQLKPRTLALMHGASFQGDGETALNELAKLYDGWFAAQRT